MTEQPTSRSALPLVIGVLIVATIIGVPIAGKIATSCDSSEAPSPAKPAPATPGCDAYAKTAVEIIAACNSDHPREVRFHLAACERQVDPSTSCIEALRALNCDAVRRGWLSAAGPVCRKYKD
jgi:hypothetical protein